MLSCPTIRHGDDEKQDIARGGADGRLILGIRDSRFIFRPVSDAQADTVVRVSVNYASSPEYGVQKQGTQVENEDVFQHDSIISP